MRTNDLIVALAADNSARQPPPGRALAEYLVPGIAIAFVVFLFTLGLRPHLFSLVSTNPRLVFKLCLALLLAGLACRFLLQIVRPGADARPAALLLALAPLLLGGAILAELFGVPHAEWGRRLWGENAMACLRSIPMLAAAPLVAILIALRSGAPERPALAGAAAGLLAGAVGAALYAMHCPDDSPLFIAAWYTLAIAAVSAAGALAGSRLLRW